MNKHATTAVLQVHYGINATANQAAGGANILDEFMGYKFLRFDMHLYLADTPCVCYYTVGLVGANAPTASDQFNLPAR